MALGDPITAAPEFGGKGFVALGASASPWMTCIDAGGIATQDNSGTITNPTTHCTAATSHIFRRLDNGPATLMARLGYDDGLTGITSPVIVMCGRYRTKAQQDAGTDVPWQRLYNKDPSPITEVTLTTASTTDIEDGTLKYTECDPRTHAWDVAGCNEFLPAKKTALAGTGSTSNAIVQCRLV